jgi:hypothetical protein
MDKGKLANTAPEGIAEGSLTAAAGETPFGTVLMGTIKTPVRGAQGPAGVTPFEALDRTLVRFEELCSNGGKLIFRNRLKGRISSKLHMMTARLSLL